MIAWSRLAMARSRPCISAIFASTALSPAALSARAAARFRLQLFGALLHRSSFLVCESLDFLLIAVVRLADFCVLFFAGFLSAIAKYLRASNEPSRLNVGAIAGRVSAAPGCGSGCPRDRGGRSRGRRTAARSAPDDLGVAGLQPLEGAVEVGVGQVMLA